MADETFEQGEELDQVGTQRTGCGQSERLKAHVHGVDQ
jgi:hypothetical protein